LKKRISSISAELLLWRALGKWASPLIGFPGISSISWHEVMPGWSGITPGWSEFVLIWYESVPGWTGQRLIYRPFNQ